MVEPAIISSSSLESGVSMRNNIYAVTPHQHVPTRSVSHWSCCERHDMLLNLKYSNLFWQETLLDLY